MAAARGGAPPAFERLYADLAPAIAGYLRVQRAPEPEDLTSQVLLRVFREIGTFDGSEQQFRTWVFTIAHGRLQELQRLHGLPDKFADRDTERVVGLCGRLAADQRTVLLLRVVADLTVDGVAQVTGTSVGEVKALQRRALAALREQLAKESIPL